MNIREEYARFIRERNIKASSYIRALELLDGILHHSPLFGHDGFWSVISAEEIDALYDYALSHQKEEGSVISGFAPYWRFSKTQRIRSMTVPGR